MQVVRDEFLSNNCNTYTYVNKPFNMKKHQLHWNDQSGTEQTEAKMFAKCMY